MRRRILALLCGAPLVAGLIVVASPAEAASPSVRIISNYAGIDANGRARIIALCSSSSACKGTIRVDDGVSSLYAYSIRGKSLAYISIAISPTAPGNPATNRAKPDTDPTKVGSQLGEIYRVPDIKLKIMEKEPRTVTHYDTINAETRLPGLVQQIRGDVVGVAGSRPVTGMKVRLIEKLRGGAEKIAATRTVNMAPYNGGYRGQYVFDVPVDVNNGATKKYYLKIEGYDPYGAPRSWWWRGQDNRYLGGARYSVDASPIAVSRYKDFRADLTYGFVSGRILAPSEFQESGSPSFVRSGVDVSVAAPPPAYGSVAAMQKLDVAGCANVYARVKTTENGEYRVDFLPLGSSQPNENKYMVGARVADAEVWVGSNDPTKARRFGSCLDASNYRGASNFQDVTRDLITLPTSSPINLPLTTPTQTLLVKKPAPKFSGASGMDRWVTIRERIPGMDVLDSPVVAEGFNGTGDSAIKVPQGLYWVETGRRLGCSAWSRSIYPNNYAYHKGADRAAERWKTVAGASAEYSKSYAMGYVKTNPGKGYRGWMYRPHCKTLSAGTINWVRVLDDKVTSTTVDAATRGAVVYGKVNRTGGRTNKEMMVRLTNSNGHTVRRTDLTDRGGKFYVAGLSPGRYTISVNSDSWRGIGRSFSGTHSIVVKAGKYHNAGTLTFKG